MKRQGSAVTASSVVDGVLLQWGERLFYPGNRIVRSATTPRLSVLHRRQAAVVRRRIEATVSRRAVQVMVKVTGGGRGMAAIAAHFRYISKGGRLAFEDDRCVVRDGKEALHDLVDQWRHGGSLIGEVGHRREALNIMLSMPDGTDPKIVKHAAREFAQTELKGHRYAMVLHDHQANPHVHLSVRAESMTGTRPNPRKADLRRWRETFAEKLRGYGIEAEATRQATRGAVRIDQPIWRLKAAGEGRPRQPTGNAKTGERYQHSRSSALEGWMRIAQALNASASPPDRALAIQVINFVQGSPFYKEWSKERQRAPEHLDAQRTLDLQAQQVPTRRDGPKLER